MMTTTMLERYRRWFDYEKDAHSKTLLSFQTVPESERTSASFQKAVTLFAHIVAARKLWLFRLGISSEAVTDFFPQEIKLEALPELAEEMNTLWDSYLETVDEAELARVFVYRSLDGDPFQNRIEDIFTQLFGHSWYHRGQIAQLIKALGGVPAVTDFVYWCREPLAEEIA
jgi:uncharacterized damage-inducible protein DinB